MKLLESFFCSQLIPTYRNLR